MATRPTAQTDTRSGPSPRMLAAAACLLALALLAWRGNAVLTAPQPAPATSPFETSLLSVIEPVAGPGLVRLSVTRTASGHRNILILLDQTVANQTETIRRIASQAAGLDLAAGDVLTIEPAMFAAGLPGRPSREETAELAMMGLLAGLLAWIAFSARPETQAEAELMSTSIAERRLVPESDPARRPVPSRDALPDEAGQAARKDPARAANILRGWMKESGEAA